MDIKVTTTKVKIDNESLNKGEYNVRECNFDLAEEFTGLVCKALFTISKTKLTYEQSIVNGKCDIPYEVTVNRGKVIVGVIAYEIEDEELVKRYSPEPDEFFVLDGSYIEDIENQSTPTPSELEQLEQRVSVIEIDASQVETNTQDIANIKLEQITQNNDISSLQTGKADKSEIPDVTNFITKDVNNLTYYELKTNTGSSILLNIDSSTYVMTLQLKNSAGTVLSTGTVDLPLETMVIDANYDSATKEIVLTLKNGNTTRFSVADLVSGLQTEITSSNKLNADLVDDSTSTNKFVTASDKTSWNAKYDKPSGGIPKTDLASSVQTSLGKADTAVQDVSGKEDKSNKVTSISSSSTDTQYPSAKAVYDNIDALKGKTVTGTGSNITLSKTANLEFVKPPLPRGNSEQVQYSGKNLYSSENISSSISNVQYTSQEDGTILANGTKSGGGWVNFSNNTVQLEPGTYSATCFLISGTISISVAVYLYGASNSQSINISELGRTGKTFEITEAGTYYLRFGVWTDGTVFNNAKIGFMLVSGSEIPTTFEKYVGGTASPNPYYPQEITNVTGDVEVLVQNKNLFDYENASDYSKTVVNAYRFAKIANIEMGENYTLYGLDTTDIQGETNLYIYITNNPAYNPGVVGGNNLCTNSNKLNSTYRQLTVPQISNTLYIGVADGNSSNVTEETWVKVLDKFKNAILVKGTYTSSNIPEYTPHKEQTLPLTLGNIELCKIGDYQDYFYKENNKWYLYKAIGKGVIPSGVNIYDLNLTGYRLPKVAINKGVLGIIRNYSNDVCLSNKWHKTTYSNPSNFGITSAAGLNELWFFIEGITSIEDARQYIEGSIFYSVQATSTITEITDTVLINQLEAISQALSYEEQTNISGTSDESNPIFEVQAVQYKEPDYWTIAYVKTMIDKALQELS